MLSRNLEKTLHRALAHATERRHEYATLEHLLLALTEDPDSVPVLRACAVDLDWLRRELLAYIDTDLADLISAQAREAKPTASFQRVLQRAAIHTQSAGLDDVTGANLLVALFAERESYAVYLLDEQDMSRIDAVNYLSHGLQKAPGTIPPASQDDEIVRGTHLRRLKSMLRRHEIEKRHETMLSPSVKTALERARTHAKDRRHEYATLEHLLLSLTEDEAAVAVLRACAVDLDRLRRELLAYIDHDLASLVSSEAEDAKPTASFQRVLQRAAIHVGFAGYEEVTTAHLLTALFDERESHAVNFLGSQGMTRFDAANFIAHGLRKNAP